MSQTLEQLARQQNTLNTISTIVRTMKTLSAINAVPYEQAATAMEGYQAVVEQSFASFVFASHDLQLLQGCAKQKLLIVFGSDHGMCGGYNEQLAQLVAGHWQQQQMPLALLCIGAQLDNALREHNLVPDRLLMPPASADGITRQAAEIVSTIEPLAGVSLIELDIDLVYTERCAHGARRPVVLQLLPLSAHLLQRPARWPGRSLPGFNLEAGRLLAALVRNHVFATVYRAQAEAMVTENAARLALMQQAEQSVQERLFELNQRINDQRQDVITNELMDVILGHL